MQSPEDLEGKGGAEDAAQGLGSMGSEVRGGLGRGPWEEGDLQGEGPHSRRLQLAFPALPNGDLRHERGEAPCPGEPFPRGLTREEAPVPRLPSRLLRVESRLRKAGRNVG